MDTKYNPATFKSEIIDVIQENFMILLRGIKISQSAIRDAERFIGSKFF